MKSHHAVAALLAVAAALYFLLASTNQPDADAPNADPDASRQPDSPEPSATGTGDSAASQTSPGGPKTKNRINWARLTQLMEAGHSTATSDAFPQATAADLERFVAKHGENAANLVAAFEHSRDRRWLERALELFPNDPRVLLAAIGSSNSTTPADGNAANHRELIERFKTADPNNPVAWLFAAQDLFKAKQTDEAIAEIRAALQRPAFYTYASERTAAAQRIYEDIGLQPLEATILANAGLTLPHMSAAQQSSRSLMELQKRAVESGNTALAEDTIELTYSLGRMFATPEASRLLIGQLIGVSMERRALDSLPPDAQRDYFPGTPQQRIVELEKQKQAVKDLVSTSAALFQSRDESLIAEYYWRLQDEGEFSALTWLKAREKK